MNTNSFGKSTVLAGGFISLLVAVAIGCFYSQLAYAEEGGNANEAPSVDAALTIGESQQTTIVVTTAEELKKALVAAAGSATAEAPYLIEVRGGAYTLTSGLFPLKIGSNTSVVMDSDVVMTNNTGNNYPIRIQGSADASIAGGKLIGGGVWVEKNSKNATVSDMVIENSPECGIKCEMGSGHVVSNNRVTGSKKYSIYMKSIDGAAEVLDNVISNGQNDGIFVYECKDFTGDIARNSISDVEETGIHIAWSAVNGDILSNNIQRAKGNGISLYHASHCQRIDGNTLDTIGGNKDGNAGNYGILLSVADLGKEGKVYVDSITNNTVRNVTYCGITVYATKEGSRYNGYAYVKGNISGNKLYKCGTYNPGKNWKNAKKRGSLAGIYIDKRGLVCGSITKNTVDKAGEYGIYAHDYSTVHDVTSNTVTNSGVDAIQLYKSTCIGSIGDNKIGNSKRYAFRMYASTLKGSFSKNVITKTADKGICIAQSSKITKAITGNKMTTVGGDAIYVGSKSVVAGIKGNVASAVKGSGVSLSDKAKVTTISSKIFTGKKTTDSRGVLVRSGCAATNIKSNTIKSMGWGITVKGTKAKTIIKSNKISKCKKNVIAIGDKKLSPSKKAKIGKVSVNR